MPGNVIAHERPTVKRYVSALALLAWSAWLACEYLAFGRASYVRQHDTAEVNTPYYTALPLLARHDLLGYRDPLAGTGVDALANLKGDMPLVEALFRYAPHWSNSGVLLLCQTFVAAIGTFALLRIRFGVSRTAALICAGWFAFLPSSSLPYSGFPTWYGWYVPGFPLLILALDYCGRSTGARGRLGAIAIGATLALGTPTASGMLVLPVVACWLFAFSDPLERRRLVLLWTLFAAAFLTVKTPAIAALVASVPDSHRTVRAVLTFDGADGADVWSTALGDLRALAVAHCVLLAVALAGWLAGGAHRRAMNITGAATLGLLGVTLMMPLMQPLLGVFGDGFRSYRLDRFNRFLPFVAAMAAALALDRLRARRNAPVQSLIGRRVWGGVYVGAMAGMIVSLVTASIWMNAGREASRMGGNRYEVFFEQATLRALASELGPGNLFRVATFADRNATQYGRHAAFAWAYGLETADLYVTTYPLRYHAFWARVIAPVRERRPDLRRYFDTWGSMAYLFNPAARLFDPLPGTADLSLRPVPFDLDLLSLANVRYILSAVPLQDERLRLRSGGGDVLVYENRDVIPRYFVAHRWDGYSTDDQLLGAMSDASTATLASTAFLDSRTAAAVPPAPPPGTLAGGSSVAVRHYAADRIDLGVDGAAPGILVIVNSYSPYWTARVDGTAAPVFPVDHAFQGLTIPAGMHDITLSYRPPQSFGGALQPFLLAAVLGLLGVVAATTGA